MKETEIWSGIQKGDYKSFQFLYSSFFAQLYAYGYKICHDANQVEDAIHDMFLDIWKYRQKLSPTTSVKFYLFRSLRRKIYKNQNQHLKETVFETDNEFDFETKTEGHDQVIIDEESILQKNLTLKKYLNLLPKRQHEALILKYYNNFSYEEIAAILKVNEQSVRNLIQRGLLKLKKLLLVFLLAVVVFQLFDIFFLINELKQSKVFFFL